MKKVALVIGIILILIALISMKPYIFDFSKLSDYGQGYIVGKVIMLVAGITLVFLGKRKKTVQANF